MLPDVPLKLLQSSVTTLFSEEAGWPHGMIKDTDSIYEKEKELGGSHPVRQVSVLTCYWGQLTYIIDQSSSGGFSAEVRRHQLQRRGTQCVQVLPQNIVVVSC